MQADVHLSCRCGAVRGQIRNVSPLDANRIVCHCKFCEAFARDLGRAADVLDEWGGSERFQVSPATLSITQGHEHVACGQLTARGPFRWYARCCKTPIALTFRGPGIPFVAVDRCIVDDSRLAAPFDAIAGPLRARVNRHFTADQARALKATTGALVSMLWHLGRLMIAWWWRGEHRRWAFFDQTTRAPIRPPQRLESHHLPLITVQRQKQRQEQRRQRIRAAGCG